MSAMLLLLFYGLSSLSSTINLFAWTELFLMRWRDPSRMPFLDDTYLLTRTALMTLSFGIAGLSGLRVSADLFGETKIEVPSIIGLFFIAAMACAEPMLLRVSYVHAVARGTRSVGWTLYWSLAAMWTLAVGMLSLPVW